MCQNHNCFGAFHNNKLVSVAETPDMPFLSDTIQHIGISTLLSYRKQGYAKRTVQAVINNLLDKNIYPQGECQSNNNGSIHLALSLGFVKVAEVITLI